MTQQTSDLPGTTVVTAQVEGVAGLGIERAGYVALRTADAAAAAAFAAEYMGLDLVNVDSDGRHYLAAAGMDPYSLVYVPGEEGVDHVSYVVHDLATLVSARDKLRSQGIDAEIEPSLLWRHEPCVRVQSPAGHWVELAPGVSTAVPMASLISAPTSAPGPISLDHFAPRVTDVDAEFRFAEKVLGLRESARVSAPIGPVLGFFRAHTLFHCYTIVRSPHNGVHHFQFTLKNAEHVYAAHERMRDAGNVEIVWGPLRHGPGHNIAFYFRDYAGNFIEYSAEEEIILGHTYVPRDWSADDQMFMDEWGSKPPDIFF